VLQAQVQNSVSQSQVQSKVLQSQVSVQVEPVQVAPHVGPVQVTLQVGGQVFSHVTSMVAQPLHVDPQVDSHVAPEQVAWSQVGLQVLQVL
jgi:hypothetical protein